MVIEKTTRIMKCTMRKIMIIPVLLGLFAWTATVTAASSTIKARVAAVRIIIVDNNNQIVAIRSNTQDDIVPIVEQNGHVIPFSTTVQDQYNALWPILQLARPTKF